MQKVFNPKSVAIIGASEKEGKIGNILMQNIKSRARFERGKRSFLEEECNEVERRERWDLEERGKEKVRDNK